VRSWPHQNKQSASPIPFAGWEYLFAATALVVFFCYLFFRVEPALRYYDSAPVFLLDKAFLGKFFSRPGGIGEYLASFLAQCEIQNWLGSLVATALAVLSFFSTRLLLRRCSIKSLFGPLVPVLLFLLLFQSYKGPVYPATIGFGIAVMLSWGYVCIPSRWIRIFAGWVGIGLTFWLFGLWPVLLLAIICVLYEVLCARQMGQGLGLLVPALAALLWEAFNAKAVFKPSLSGWALAACITLYLCIPVIILVHKTVLKLQPHPAQKAKVTLHSWRETVRRWLPRFGVAAGLIYLMWAGFVFDTHQKKRLDIRYHTARKEWAEAARAAIGIQVIDSAAQIDLLRALFHSGHMCEDLFTYPLPYSAELFPGVTAGPKACFP
jgi:hypothetical protein